MVIFHHLYKLVYSSILSYIVLVLLQENCDSVTFNSILEIVSPCSTNSRKVLESRFSLEVSPIGFYSLCCGYSMEVFVSWPECQNQVHGYKDTKYKKLSI